MSGGMKKLTRAIQTVLLDGKEDIAKELVRTGSIDRREEGVLKAKLAFVLDPYKRDIDHYFKYVEDTEYLTKRAKEENWIAIREKNQAEQFRQLLTKLNVSINSERIKVMNDLRFLQSALLLEMSPMVTDRGDLILEDNRVKFRHPITSFSEAIKVFKVVTSVLQNYENKMLPFLTSRTEEEKEDVEGAFSDEEYKLAADAILAKRIEKRRKGGD